MKEENLLDWIEAEVSRYMRKYGCPNLYEKNDLISEGYLIAIDAIKKFDEQKKASVKTYIQKCVKNRLLDISRYQRRRICHSLPESQDRSSFSDLIYKNYVEPKSDDFFPYIDMCITLEKIKSPQLEDLISGEIASMNKLRKNGQEGVG